MSEEKGNIISQEKAYDLDPEKLQVFRKSLIKWSSKNLRKFPWRTTRDPYRIMLAEFFLQQTNAASAENIYRSFLEKYPNILLLSQSSIEDLSVMMGPLGLHYRAGRIHKIAQIIVQDFDGRIPDSEDKLLMLPGIGPYIARSICASAFGQQKAVLDTNVVRIVNRFFGIKRHQKMRERDDSRYWQLVEEIAPSINTWKWNLTLLDFGALVCKAKSPNCKICELKRFCSFYGETLKQS